jgi:hypothetical protein
MEVPAETLVVKRFLTLTGFWGGVATRRFASERRIRAHSARISKVSCGQKNSSSLAVVVFQQAAKAFSTLKWPVVCVFL